MKMFWNLVSRSMQLVRNMIGVSRKYCPRILFILVRNKFIFVVIVLRLL